MGLQDCMAKLQKSSRKKSNFEVLQFGLRGFMALMSLVCLFAAFHHYAPGRWISPFLALIALGLIAIAVRAAMCRNEYIQSAALGSLFPLITSAYIICWLTVFSFASSSASVGGPLELDYQLDQAVAVGRSVIGVSLIYAVGTAAVAVFLKWQSDRGVIGVSVSDRNDIKFARRSLPLPVAFWGLVILAFVFYVGCYLSLSSYWPPNGVNKHHVRLFDSDVQVAIFRPAGWLESQIRCRNIQLKSYSEFETLWDIH
jgi:hypothetical protein